jgi:DNA-binding response OmpR family regulator
MNKQSDTPRILVADADPLTNEMVKLVSETQSYRFVPVTNGREAFRLLRHDANFDLAIFDGALTQPHCTDLLRYMKTEKRLVRIPTIVLSSDESFTIAAETFAAGALVFLSKPFGFDLFLRAIRVALNSQSRPRAQLQAA